MESTSHRLPHAPRAFASEEGQSGFTLIEIMIGLAIGMLLTLVILQVMSVFEAQTRTTSGTADAQTNGGIALYSITREIQMTGYGLLPVTNSAHECTTFSINGVPDPTVPNRLTPVTITSGPAPAGDTLTLRYGNSNMGGVPTQILVMGAPTANDATVGTNLGCQVGDVSLVTNGTTCAMSSITAVSAVGVVPKTVTLANTTGTALNANLACLGTWNEITYAVNGGNLTRNGVASVPGIVSLQAQYGISNAANSNQITQWVEATGATWSAPSVANRNRIKAIRVAIVARNDRAEMSDVTSACSSTINPAPTGLCAWEGIPSPPMVVSSPAPTIDMSVGTPDWRRYRYRVYETIIPVRNMVWARATL